MTNRLSVLFFLWFFLWKCPLTAVAAYKKEIVHPCFITANTSRLVVQRIICTADHTQLDVVLYGRDGAKLIYIISDHSDSITKRILEELDIGVTHMQGTGAYSGKEKNVIMCAIRKQLAPKAEEIVKEEDPLAFMIVTSATEIFGEGYKSYFSEKF